MRKIVFTKQGSSSEFGNFGPGDVLRCSDAQAEHFVGQAQCAQYADAQAPAEEAAPKPADRGAQPTPQEPARKKPARPAA